MEVGSRFGPPKFFRVAPPMRNTDGCGVSNFMKSGRREIDEIVRCLPDNVHRVPHITSESVHFWPTYSRTRERREYRQNKRHEI